MSEPITGIHHVTAIATDPQRNVDFHAGVLGLRLVKRTVNFDDPGTYHFYFGDELGRPGTILTFFPWPLARRGTRGAGQVTVTAFAVPEGSLSFWRKRLATHGVVAEEPKRRFDAEVLVFHDYDGLELELVAAPGAGGGEPWGEGPVAPEHAIRGFHGVTLALRAAGPTAELLTSTMGLSPAGESGRRSRFSAAEGAPGRHVDLLEAPEMPFGTVAAGSVHHVAWRVPDEPAQEAWRGRLTGVGLHPTPVLDRQYFRSIYFREPGGVLFEFATDGPGFTRDEQPATLGSEIKLPPWLEPERERIEQRLPRVRRPAAASGR